VELYLYSPLCFYRVARKNDTLGIDRYLDQKSELDRSTDILFVPSFVVPLRHSDKHNYGFMACRGASIQYISSRNCVTGNRNVKNGISKREDRCPTNRDEQYVLNIV
jgi:hypothetical protein